MTPSEVRRMDRKDCILFMEGQSPIYDQKNLPWIYSKKLYDEAMSFNGKDGKAGYIHPVKTVYDADTMTYRTITEKKVLQVLEKEDVEFYKRAAQTDKTIKVMEIDEQDLLYLNFKDEPNLTEEEIAALFRKKENRTEELPEDIKNLGEDAEPVSDLNTKETWDLSRTALDCLKRYADQLSDEEVNEILLGMEQGLSDRQIKTYFCLPVTKMQQYRRVYLLENGK